jgi:hypothetical protein
VGNAIEPRRHRSTLSKLDDVLLVVVVAVVALVALQFIGWVLGTLMWLVKAAVVVGLVALAVAYVNRRHDR